jgi:hypothetical protein
VGQLKDAFKYSYYIVYHAELTLGRLKVLVKSLI